MNIIGHASTNISVGTLSTQSKMIHHEKYFIISDYLGRLFVVIFFEK